MLNPLTALAVVVTIVAALLVFAQDRVFDADSFSTTVASALEDPAVNDYLADAISDALIEQVPDLAIGGPLLAEVTGSVLGSDVAVRTVEIAASQAHGTVFDRGENTVVLELADLVVSIEQALAGIDPDLAERVPDEVSTLAVDISSGEWSVGAARVAERLRLLTWVVAALAVVLLIAIAAVERSLFHGLARLGLALAVAGLVLVVLRAAGSAIVASYGRDGLESDALEGAWNLVLGDLALWGWAFVVVGGFLASLGWALLRVRSSTFDLVDVANRLRREPSTALGSIVRWIGLFVVALWALLHPDTLLLTMVRVTGFAAIVALAVHALVRSGAADRLASIAPESHDEVVGPAQLARRSVAPLIAAVALGAIGVWLLSANDAASALVDPEACNGHVELCDRRLDEVAMAASHNSMSSTATGFVLPNHLTTMRAQLDQGVRAFMIDTVYGRRASDRSVRTVSAPASTETLGAEAEAAVEAVRERQTADLDPQAVYLCHGFCEIGALDAVGALRDVRAWLDAHPREVLVFVVQDTTTPADTAAMFDEAGLADLVLTHDLDDPLPTLGEMIASGRRVFVMVEAEAGDVAWLHPAFEFSQETPFSFSSVEEFSCAPNRGRADSPLFVVNHFITLARPSNQSINDFDVLHERVTECEAERGLVANLVSVDFVGQGDVMQVIDALNDVD